MNRVQHFSICLLQVSVLVFVAAAPAFCQATGSGSTTGHGTHTNNAHSSNPYSHQSTNTGNHSSNTNQSNNAGNNTAHGNANSTNHSSNTPSVYQQYAHPSNNGTNTTGSNNSKNYQPSNNNNSKNSNSNNNKGNSNAWNTRNTNTNTNHNAGGNGTNSHGTNYSVNTHTTVQTPVYHLPRNLTANTGNRAVVLQGRDSQSVLLDVNRARSHMGGINRRPLPTGITTVQPGGGLSIVSGAKRFGVRPDGRISSFSDHSGTVNFRANGRISSFQGNGMMVRHDLHGGRFITSTRPDKSVLVSTGSHSGFLQRTVVVQNRTYVQRVYVVNNVTYTRFYNTYNYHGVALNVYIPHVYYPPAYYRYAYTRWNRPYLYTWGWRQEPWYAYYHAYYVPAQQYPSASYWLADYVVGQTLRDAYEQQTQAQVTPTDNGSGANDANSVDYVDNTAGTDTNGGSGNTTDTNTTPNTGDNNGQTQPDANDAQGGTSMTPEIRAAIAQEVEQQLQAEQSAAQNQNAAISTSNPSFLQDPRHIFVISSALDITGDGGNECELNAGDVVQMTGSAADGAVNLSVRVVSSQGGDCSAGRTVSLAVSALQDQENQFLAKLDSGMEALKHAQGGSLPSAPSGAVTAGNPSVADSAPTDADVSAMLDAQQQQANTQEAAMMRNAFAPDETQKVQNQ